MRQSGSRAMRQRGDGVIGQSRNAPSKRYGDAPCRQWRNASQWRPCNAANRRPVIRAVRQCGNATMQHCAVSPTHRLAGRSRPMSLARQSVSGKTLTPQTPATPSALSGFWRCLMAQEFPETSMRRRCRQQARFCPGSGRPDREAGRRCPFRRVGVARGAFSEGATTA